MVSGAAASVPTRFVEQRHHLHRQAAGELPGERILRLIAVIVTLLVAAATAAAMSGGMADVGALLVRAARNGGMCSRSPAGS
jgi:hypothetical protein